MGKKSNPPEIRIPVHGVDFDVFASVKRPMYLRFYGAIVLLLLAMAIWMAVTGKLKLSSLIFVAVVALLMGVLIRSTMKGEYRKSGIGSMELTYSFTEKGWSVRRGEKTASVKWADTFLLKRNALALLLYPNKKSVNVVPIRGIPENQVKQILKWYGKNAKNS